MQRKIAPPTPSDSIAQAVVTGAADIETASAKYHQRFRGKTGAWFLREQQRHLLSLLAPWPGARILDVGGGHGQYTEGLLQAGYEVTVLGSSPEAGERIQPLVAAGRCAYKVGDLLTFPVADAAYDIAISFRLMTHSEDWRRLVRELARVAKQAVIIDFPVLDSFNVLYPMLFWAKRIGESNTTRTFHIFKTREVVTEFQQAGGKATAVRRQFFFPMVVHRIVRLTSLSMAIEAACRRLGLTARFGSPAVLRIEPD